ncbi:hypothetical protein ACFQZ0_00325 [Streptomyces erythrogriseus]|uniref:Uncharacterized protein n=1 Tax=Streptomyces erythrogriseus TaxID=284027 RepID=A0ABP6J1E3_9ACTN
MASKRVRVTLHSIFNDNTGDDPGDALELYGRCDANRMRFDPDIAEVVPLEHHNLWHRTGDNPKSVTEGDAFIIESSTEMDLFDGEFIQIAGHVSDQDDFGENDVLGHFDERINFSDFGNGLVHIPQLSESNQRVNVKVSTRVL